MKFSFEKFRTVITKDITTAIEAKIGATSKWYTLNPNKVMIIIHAAAAPIEQSKQSKPTDFFRFLSAIFTKTSIPQQRRLY
ncbi:MAG: hypothetical protein FWG63_10345 [Defluviitaleaceae bacterium]|nr:hypothetical protein [Defluviitaleaceae bacterium]